MSPKKPRCPVPENRTTALLRLQFRISRRIAGAAAPPQEPLPVYVV